MGSVFGFLVLCILKVSRAAGSLHRVVGPMHASMSGCRLRTLPLQGIRIRGPVDHGVLPGGWYSSVCVFMYVMRIPWVPFRGV